MGRATSKGNEAKSKRKQPSDMPTPRFEHGCQVLWSNTLPLDHRGAPDMLQVYKILKGIDRLESNQFFSPQASEAPLKIKFEAKCIQSESA